MGKDVVENIDTVLFDLGRGVTQGKGQTCGSSFVREPGFTWEGGLELHCGKVVYLPLEGAV